MAITQAVAKAEVAHVAEAFQAHAFHHVASDERAVQRTRAGDAFGAGGGLGLPIIGKLLGHTQASTTQRYAHLDAGPSKIGPFGAAAIRLLLFTGCRLREVLHLKWEQVDLERGLLFLADSKTGKKTVILNAPALTVLAGLGRIGS